MKALAQQQLKKQATQAVLKKAVRDPRLRAAAAKVGAEKAVAAGVEKVAGGLGQVADDAVRRDVVEASSDPEKVAALRKSLGQVERTVEVGRKGLLEREDALVAAMQREGIEDAVVDQEADTIRRAASVPKPELAQVEFRGAVKVASDRTAGIPAGLLVAGGVLAVIGIGVALASREQ